MTAPPALSAAQQQAWVAYRELRLGLDARVARDLETDSGLSMPDFDVLAAVRAIAGHGESAGTWLVPIAPDPHPGARTAHCVRVAALADRMGWSRSRLSRQLGRMERRGLIARVPCELDGRGDDVELTEAGARALADAEPGFLRSVRAHFADVLTEQQLVALTQISATLTHRRPSRS
ncbi:MAG TPA: MarR family transcriptional regulator [Pseudonocardia sp.]|nr:MarR family transcriptional regulator [Pseudonocardia sp.]